MTTPDAPSASEVRYEIRRAGSATTLPHPRPVAQVVLGDEGYRLVDHAGEQLSTIHASLMEVLESHPDVLVVPTAGITTIRSSELEDWQIGDHLRIADPDALTEIAPAGVTDVPGDNGTVLDLSCKINEVDWWYYRLADEPSGFFVPGDLGDRSDLEEVGAFRWVPESARLDSYGTTLCRLGTLYELWAPEVCHDLYRTSASPRQEALAFFEANPTIAQGFACPSDSIEMTSPYLSEDDFEGVINSHATAGSGTYPRVVTVNGSPWSRDAQGTWRSGQTSGPSARERSDPASAEP